MKKLNFQVITMMLIALLYADVVPAAENSGGENPEGFGCFLWSCTPPPPKTPVEPSTDSTFIAQTSGKPQVSSENS